MNRTSLLRSVLAFDPLDHLAAECARKCQMRQRAIFVCFVVEWRCRVGAYKVASRQRRGIISGGGCLSHQLKLGWLGCVPALVGGFSGRFLRAVSQSGRG